ncbi:MAG: hypothetical protein V4494_02350 [Chlamydiota bacterium]
MTTTVPISPTRPIHISLNANQCIRSQLPIESLCTIVFQKTPKELCYSENPFIYPFPRCRSVIEFTSEKARQTTLNNIKKIENKTEKLDRLEEAIRQGNFNDPIFNLTNENLDGLEGHPLLEFPFVALYGLRHLELTVDDYSLIQSYYGLRTKYTQENIQAHLLIHQDNTVNEQTKEMLRRMLLQGNELSGAYLQVFNNKIERLVQYIRADNLNKHQLVFFSVTDPEIHNYTYISKSIWTCFELVAFTHFDNKQSFASPSIEILNLAEKILRLYPHDGFIRAETTFMEDDSIRNKSTLEVFKYKNR